MVSKAKHNKQSPSGIKQVSSGDARLRFSFQFFDVTDDELCPKAFADGYTQTLMCRMRDISTWTVQEFITPKGKAVRNHTIAWPETSRPDGFAHLPEQYEAYQAYQFTLTANEHGRVHGFLMNDTFQVVWLDCNHRLYP